jgi:5-oxopent-3-ene-1,2,5-tricarboxylate decarboxylase/2-hydroxyhepta-2,4-diene-1,7-dioate isomerase
MQTRRILLDGVVTEVTADGGALLPGDVILSGTPAGSRPVQPGDEVSVSVSGLGTLTSTITVGPTPIPAGFGAQPTSCEEVISTALGGDWEFRGIRPRAATN